MQTFHNLQSVEITTYTCDSDGKPIKETGRKETVLFNKQAHSEKEILEMDNTKFFHLKMTGEILVVPEIVAKNLADKE